jgi:hypothetical protein
MHFRNLLHALAALAVLSVLNVAVVKEAQAKLKICAYSAHQFTPTDKGLFTKFGRASKMSRACRKARRQCNRKLDRWRRQGKVGRARCERL